MKILLNNYLLISFISFAFLNESKSVYAKSTAFVYCADENKNWYWLNSGKVKINGDWQLKFINLITYIIYFKIDGGIEKLNELKQECKSEFGNNFKFAQAANDESDGWYPIGISNNNVIQGHYSTIKIFNRF